MGERRWMRLAIPTGLGGMRATEENIFRRSSLGSRIHFRFEDADVG